jgi:tetratricopeptide (TPR) repeat protein
MRFAASAFLVVASTVLAGCAAAADSSGYSAWSALLVIAVSGFFGGFVDGLRTIRTYSLRFGTHSWDLGSLADGLVGMAAAIAIFAFAESIFSGVTSKPSVQAWDLVKIAAWGVLSGYAGTKLLDDLSSKAIRRMIQEETSKEVAKQKTEAGDAKSSIDDARQLWTEYLTKIRSSSKGQPDEVAENLLERSIAKYKAVLQQDPLNSDAQNGLANAVADLGVYYKDYVVDPKRADEQFKEAIKIQDERIKRNPTVATIAKAYYNRACYKAVAGESAYSKDKVLEDLREAIKRDEHWKDYARKDPDLARLHLQDDVNWNSFQQFISAAT